MYQFQSSLFVVFRCCKSAMLRKLCGGGGDGGCGDGGDGGGDGGGCGGGGGGLVFRVRPLCKSRPPQACTPNLHTNIIPTNIARLKLSGKFPMGLEIPPLRIKITLESNPLKSTMLVRRLAVGGRAALEGSPPPRK